jgi:hypothetical protein
MTTKSIKRQKLAVQLAPAQTKPRNPLVAAAARRVAGRHEKSMTGIRMAQKRALKKLLSET